MNNKVEKDKCVSCSKDTEYDVDTPIDERLCFVAGSGQLCKKCWDRIYGEKAKIEKYSDGLSAKK